MHNSGGWKPEVQVSAGLFSSEVSLPGQQAAAVSLCPHTVPALCAQFVQISSSEDTSHTCGIRAEPEPLVLT